MPFFKYQNILAETALKELTNQLMVMHPDSIQLGTIIPEDTIKAFQVIGEPNFGEKYIFITSKSGVLDEILSGSRELYSLTKEEWSQVLNPSPTNKLVYFYFKKLYNAYKVKANSPHYNGTAYDEILMILRSGWKSRYLF